MNLFLRMARSITGRSTHLVENDLADYKKGNALKKILFSVLLFLGLNVSVHAEDMRAKVQAVKENVQSRPNDYVYDNAYGYAVPAGAACQQYIDIIKKKDAEIKSLSKELDSLRAEQQLQLQKYLKKKHDKEMKKFDEKRNDTAAKKTNKIIISDKPVQ